MVMMVNPAPTKSYFDLVEKYEQVKDKSTVDLELFFQGPLAAYGVRHVRNPDTENSKNDQFPDFSVWSDELSSVLGNSVGVKIKKGLKSAG